MSVTKKTQVGTVDMTPKWVEVVHLLVDMTHNGTEAQRDVASKELDRMARAADAYVATAFALRVSMGQTSEAIDEMLSTRITLDRLPPKSGT